MRRSGGQTQQTLGVNSTKVRSKSVVTRASPGPTLGGSSKVTRPGAKTDEDADNLYRVRSFTTKTGVVVNRGDSFKRRSPRPNHVGDVAAADSAAPGVIGLHTGRVYLPPPSSTVSASFDREPEVAADFESVPVGTGRIVHEFSDRSRDQDYPQQHHQRDDNAESFDSPRVVVAQQPRREPAGANLEVTWRKTRRHSSVDAGAGGGGGGGGGEDPAPAYKVVVLGSHGVGKTTLTQQLLTSEYYSGDCNNTGEDHDEETVTVQLDDEESIIQFIDTPGTDMGKTPTISGASENRLETRQGSRDFGKTTFIGGDGFLVIYSVTDRASFRFAQSCLQELRPAKRHNAVILVANKHDLVRNRLVSETEGIKLATKRHCKFIEVSALLDHRLDELLVGMVRQIRLRQTRNNLRTDSNSAEAKGSTGNSITETIGTFFQRIFKRDRTGGGKCEDLMVP